MLGIENCFNLPSNTDDESQFRLGRDIEAANLLGFTTKPDLIMLLSPVFLNVLFSTFEDLNTSCAASFQVLILNKDNY